MFSWLLANLGTIVVGLLVLAAVAAAVRHLIRERRSGKSACSCGCAGCPHSGVCHAAPPNHSPKPH